MCLLNFYLCFDLDDLHIGDFIATDITKCKLLTNHLKPDYSYKFPLRF